MSDGRIQRFYQPLNKSLVTTKCKKGTEINTRKCSHLWPRYPCYNKRMQHCESTEGIANLDPIDDILYAVGESYVAVTNLIGKLFNVMPKEKQIESEEKLIRFFREYGTTLSPLPNAQLKAFDQARNTDIDAAVDTISEKVPEVAKKTLDIINKMNPARELVDDINSHGGGKIYTKIVNPLTGRKVSIYSKKGQEVLQNYFMNM